MFIRNTWQYRPFEVLTERHELSFSMRRTKREKALKVSAVRFQLDTLMRRRSSYLKTLHRIIMRAIDQMIFAALAGSTMRRFLSQKHAIDKDSCIRSAFWIWSLLGFRLVSKNSQEVRPGKMAISIQYCRRLAVVKSVYAP